MSDHDQQHEALFRWPSTYHNSVILTGTFDQWAKNWRLKKGPNGFEGSVRIPWGEKVAYKFIVDGTWRLLADQPTEHDPSGKFVNNVYTAPPSPALETQPQKDTTAGANAPGPEPDTLEHLAGSATVTSDDPELLKENQIPGVRIGLATADDGAKVEAKAAGSPVLQPNPEFAYTPTVVARETPCNVASDLGVAVGGVADIGPVDSGQPPSSQPAHELETPNKMANHLALKTSSAPVVPDQPDLTAAQRTKVAPVTSAPTFVAADSGKDVGKDDSGDNFPLNAEIEAETRNKTTSVSQDSSPITMTSNQTRESFMTGDDIAAPPGLSSAQGWITTPPQDIDSPSPEATLHDMAESKGPIPPREIATTSQGDAARDASDQECGDTQTDEVEKTTGATQQPDSTQVSAQPDTAASDKQTSASEAGTSSKAPVNETATIAPVMMLAPSPEITPTLVTGADDKCAAVPTEKASTLGSATPFKTTAQVAPSQEIPEQTLASNADSQSTNITTLANIPPVKSTTPISSTPTAPSQGIGEDTSVKAQTAVSTPGHLAVELVNPPTTSSAPSQATQGIGIDDQLRLPGAPAPQALPEPTPTKSAPPPPTVAAPTVGSQATKTPSSKHHTRGETQASDSKTYGSSSSGSSTAAGRKKKRGWLARLKHFLHLDKEKVKT